MEMLGIEPKTFCMQNFSPSCFLQQSLLREERAYFSQISKTFPSDTNLSLTFLYILVAIKLMMKPRGSGSKRFQVAQSNITKNSHSNDTTITNDLRLLEADTRIFFYSVILSDMSVGRNISAHKSQTLERQITWFMSLVISQNIRRHCRLPAV